MYFDFAREPFFKNGGGDNFMALPFPLPEMNILLSVMIIVQKACYSSTVSLQTDWEIGALSLKLHVAVTRHHFRLVLPVAWPAHKVLH